MKNFLENSSQRSAFEVHGDATDVWLPDQGECNRK